MVVVLNNRNDFHKDLCTTHWLCLKQGRFFFFEALFQGKQFKL